MNSSNDLSTFMDLATVFFPSAEKIIDDLWIFISEIGFVVEVDGNMLNIKKEIELDIVSISVHKYKDQKINFGDHCRICVAVGGLLEVKHAFPVAGLCFANMIYTSENKLPLIDFYNFMP